MLLDDNMRFDLLLVSDQYEYQGQPGAFAVSRLDAVRSSPTVAQATPIYFGAAKWKGGEGGVWPDLFVIGFDPRQRRFCARQHRRSSSERARPARHDPRRQRDPADLRPAGHRSRRRNRRSCGDDRRAIRARDRVHGARRRHGRRGEFRPAVRGPRAPTAVNLGPIRLKPGVDPVRAAAELRRVAGPGTQIFTRDELARHETSYWTTRTSVGLVFGSGLLISVVVGVMVVYQIVSAQVSRQLPQFATLKAADRLQGRELRQLPAQPGLRRSGRRP